MNFELVVIFLHISFIYVGKKILISYLHFFIKKYFFFP